MPILTGRIQKQSTKIVYADVINSNIKLTKFT